MNNYKKTLELVAERHSHIFTPSIDEGGKKFWPGNTHENCARLLWDFCEEMSKLQPLDRIGLLTKNPGENGYTWSNGIRTSHDVIAIPNGERTDIIGAAGDITEQPTITWQPRTPDQWRPHNVWIAHTSVKNIGKTPELPPSVRIPYDEAKSVEFGLACNKVYEESKAAVDPGMISVHSQRAAWDYYVGGLTWEESKKKHINEFRAVYGLKPL